MLGVSPEYLWVRVERQVDLKEAEQDPLEVLKTVRDLSKEQAIREDDWRSARRSGRPSCTGVEKWNGPDPSTRDKPPGNLSKKRDLDSGESHIGGGSNETTTR